MDELIHFVGVVSAIEGHLLFKIKVAHLSLPMS
jgi:hypothetical protein